MRVVRNAPVDILGCEKQADPLETKNIQNFQTLIALLISVQTKDETTDKVMKRFREAGCNPTKIL
jgi:endonuclease-3